MNKSQVELSDNFDGEIATLNLGPTHPATHGIFRMYSKSMESEY